jgi:two-component system phosphate regulon response regulator PhoB
MQLLDRVWGQDYVESADVVRLYVGYLRRKIELDPSSPKLIETSRGFGYRYRKP